MLAHTKTRPLLAAFFAVGSLQLRRVYFGILRFRVKPHGPIKADCLGYGWRQLNIIGVSRAFSLGEFFAWHAQDSGQAAARNGYRVSN